MRYTQFARHLLALSFYIFGVVVLAGLGCSSSSSQPERNKDKAGKLPMAKHGNSSLSGKITYRGEPIQAGRLFFVTADKHMVPELAIIRSNGTYHAKGLPAEDLKICVFLDPDGPYPFPMPPPGMEPPEMKKNKLPEGLHPIHKMPSTDPDTPKVEPKEGAEDGTETAKTNPEVAKGPPKKDRKSGPKGGRKMPPMGGEQGGRGGPGAFPSLPGHLLKDLKDYQMPSGKEAMYKELHKKFAFPSDENHLRVTISPGENKLDIDLDAKPPAGE